MRDASRRRNRKRRRKEKISRGATGVARSVATIATSTRTTIHHYFDDDVTTRQGGGTGTLFSVYKVILVRTHTEAKL